MKSKFFFIILLFKIIMIPVYGFQGKNDIDMLNER